MKSATVLNRSTYRPTTRQKGATRDIYCEIFCRGQRPFMATKAEQCYCASQKNVHNNSNDDDDFSCTQLKLNLVSFNTHA